MSVSSFDSENRMPTVLRDDRIGARAICDTRFRHNLACLGFELQEPMYPLQWLQRSASTASSVERATLAAAIAAFGSARSAGEAGAASSATVACAVTSLLSAASPAAGIAVFLVPPASEAAVIARGAGDVTVSRANISGRCSARRRAVVLAVG